MSLVACWLVGSHSFNRLNKITTTDTLRQIGLFADPIELLRLEWVFSSSDSAAPACCYDAPRSRPPLNTSLRFALLQSTNSTWASLSQIAGRQALRLSLCLCSSRGFALARQLCCCRLSRWLRSSAKSIGFKWRDSNVNKPFACA